MTARDDKDAPSIEELCRPLSARVEPRTALLSTAGRTMTPAMARQAARGGRAPKWKKTPKDRK